MEVEISKKRNLAQDDDEDDFDEEDEDTLEDMYLVFSCENKHYALEIKYITEILARQTITEIPDLPNYIMGIINLRGKVFPVIDVRLRFNMSKDEYTERTCFVIATLENATIGLIVDSVLEVIKILPSDFEPAPRMGNGISSRFVRGIGKVGESVKILLDLYSLLHEKELRDVGDKIQEIDGLKSHS